jgi:ComF family protein
VLDVCKNTHFLDRLARILLMRLIIRLLNLVAPDDCTGCQAEGSILCPECAERIDCLPATCYVCGKLSRNFRPCLNCINKWRPQHVWFYGAYKDLPAELVKALKFDQKRSAAKAMAKLLDQALPYFAEPPLVTFVPTASSRRRERGFDQAQLIGKELAKLRGWPITALLHRQAKVRQLGAGRATRRAQLKKAFRPINASLIKNTHILLVDDVVTTGATIEACTKTLLKAGASAVDCAVFAYTPKNRR